MNAPDHMVAEIVDGELYLSPRPARPHARAGTRLGGVLNPFQDGMGGPGGWDLYTEPELHFGKDVVVPDMAGWRLERIKDYPYDAKYFTIAPDWLCEVLSPSTARFDRQKKLRVYARAHVSVVWLMDPRPRTLEVLMLERGRWKVRAVHEGDAPVRVVPFESIELPLGFLWPHN